MKYYLPILLILITCLKSYSQEFNLKIIGNNEEENKIINNIDYKIKHKNIKSVFDENNLFVEKLIIKGYIDHQIDEKKKINDSTFVFKYTLNQKTNFIHIYMDSIYKKVIDPTSKDYIDINFEESENFIKSIIGKLENKGYPFSKVNLTNIQKKNNTLFAQLNITLNSKRYINNFVVYGYEKFPEGQKKNLLRNYQKKLFTQSTLKNLYQDIEKLRYVKQTRFPETLFTKDSTNVFIYLEKSKTNSFDGLVGFTNSEKQKLIFTGYLDLSLNNILNSGEKLNLQWKSNGQNQKTFDLATEFPFVFNSPFGIKAQLNIFKQDSTFQNTKTSLNIGHYFNYNKKLFLGYQSTESSDIQNINTGSLSDFKNSFFTIGFEYKNYSTESIPFPENSNIDFNIGFGKRTSNVFSDHQTATYLTISQNIHINQKNCINLKSQNYLLNSNHYFSNELERFGGSNSIRGFNESSLFGNLFLSILSEYRYILSSNLYIHSITDYAILQNKSSNNQNKLLGLGLGLGLLTKSGNINISYANGSSNNQPIKLSNSIIHIKYKTDF